MIFDASNNHRYRDATERVTRSASGIANPSRICHKCGKRSMGLGRKPGTGTSRLNPSVWLCKECK